jgi:hypothetical protein
MHLPIGLAPTLLKNIRLGRKVTNTLAYLAHSKVTKNKHRNIDHRWMVFTKILTKSLIIKLPWVCFSCEMLQIS